MPEDSLLAFIGDDLVGRIDRRGSMLRLSYDGGYSSRRDASPLSLSLPLEEGEIEDQRVEGWMSGLLPGNLDVRERWAAKYQAGSDSPFDLLSTRIGLDCPGAVRFCLPENLDALEERYGGVEWLDDTGFEDLVLGMVREPAQWVRPTGHSAFSLGGAQAKTALHRREGRWGEAIGSVPTTHILKPSMRDLDDQSVNEHLCLTAARYCGFPAVRSEVAVVAGHPVLVVRRFDRLDVDGTTRRIHQEDLHQACGEPGVPIYQNDRGEGHSLRRLARLIANHSDNRDADLRVFFDAQVFNWVICNTDGHSKNFSLLLAGGRVRLAPLYDIWSMMPYDPHHYRSYSLAMSALLDRRILTAESRQAWEATAKAVGLPGPEGPDRAAAIAEAAPEAMQQAADELSPELRALPVVQNLVSMAAHRRDQCLAGLAKS